MAGVTLDDDRLLIGHRLAVSFQRTLRVPDDGRSYPLPPTLGRFPVHPMDDNHFFVPMYQREALWVAFDGAAWNPTVVKIGVGGINAVSGEGFDPAMAPGPQDYVVCPPQLWVDGVNARDGHVRQFVCTPLGEGGTIEAQLRGADEVAGIQLAVFEARPGVFPEEPPSDGEDLEGELPFAAQEMGVGAGGLIVQKIYADPWGIATWQPEPAAEVFVHLLNSEQYRSVTGLEPPPTPVDTQDYIAAGLPWFEVYDADAPHVPPSSALGGVSGAP